MPKQIGRRKWVHRSALTDLSSTEQGRVRSLEREVPFAWTVARVDDRGTMLGRTTSFDKPHPELLESCSWVGGVFTHRQYKDPPVYHRVEQMLLESDPRRARHAATTAREQAAGLLSRPDIGRRSGWAKVSGSAAQSSMFDELMKSNKGPSCYATGLHYASGLKGVAEVWAFGYMRRPIGVSLKECSLRCIHDLADVSHRYKVPIFIDTGAYSESAAKPITPAMWRKRLNRVHLLMRQIRSYGGGGPVLFVAPDKMGDQKATLERLRTYRHDLARLSQEGVDIMVPLQKGPMSLIRFHDAVDRMLRGAIGDWVSALPLKRNPYSPAQVETYLRARQPKAVHLLGVGPRSKQLGPMGQALAAGRPDMVVTMDSAHYRTSAKDGMMATLKTRRAEGLDTVLGHRSSGYPEYIRLPDFTEESREVSTFTTPAQRLTIAQEAGLSPMETMEFMGDPDEFSQSEDEEGTPWFMRLDQWLDQAQNAHSTREEQRYARAVLFCELLSQEEEFQGKVPLYRMGESRGRRSG